MLAEAGLRTEMVLVDTLEDFTAALERENVDIILGDFKLPTCTGIQALEMARKTCPDTPFILVSGTIGEQAAMFFLDPSGNAIEFKAFKDPGKLFAR